LRSTRTGEGQEEEEVILGRRTSHWQQSIKRPHRERKGRRVAASCTCLYRSWSGKKRKEEWGGFAWSSKRHLAFREKGERHRGCTGQLVEEGKKEKKRKGKIPPRFLIRKIKKRKLFPWPDGIVKKKEKEKDESAKTGLVLREWKKKKKKRGQTIPCNPN